MPNKKDDFDIDIEEIKKTIEKLKSSGASQEDIELIENMLNAIINREKKPLIIRFLYSSLAFMIKFIAMIIISLVLFGFMKDSIILENRWLILIISLIVSITLIIYDKIYWYKYNPFKKSYIPFFIFILLIAIAFLINSTHFQIFNHSSMWIFYFPIARILYLFIDFYITKKFLTF